MPNRKLTPSSGNVFADLQLDAPEKLQTRARLLSEVVSILDQRKMTQAQTARVLAIDQPRVSALKRGKLSMFSTDKLLGFLSALGNDVDIIVKKRTHTKRAGRVHVVAAA